MKLASLFAAATLSLIATSAHAQTQDIAAIVMSDPQFSTLAKVVNTAGLAERLKRRGPLTVFAPTNAAFAKIPPAALSKLLANKEELSKLLQYHAIPGKVLSSSLKPSSVRSVAGPPLIIKVSPVLMVNNAKIVKTNIQATNGIIHAVDTVLIPSVSKHRKKIRKLPM